MRYWLFARRQSYLEKEGCSRTALTCRPTLECLEDRMVPSAGLAGFTTINLASDVPGLARVLDSNIVNPWGLSYSPTGPFWLAENGTGVSDLRDGRGQTIPLLVQIPGPGRAEGAPTGTVFNGGSGFVISENGSAHPGRFIFATLNGTINAWNTFVDPQQAHVTVDNSASGAAYTGLALATDSAGDSFLYAADFSHGTVDVFDQNFKPVLRLGAFLDPTLPAGYTPFNVQSIGNRLFVTYAQVDGRGDSDIPGSGHGFVDVYDTSGNLLQHFAAQGELNSPWGLALAPADFGAFGGALLVGNNGDGRILAFNATSGAYLGQLADDQGSALAIPDLWALSFGNDHAGGAPDTLFFTAGVASETHGLFGAIQPPQRQGADTGGAGVFDPDAPGEPDDYPLPPVAGPSLPPPRIDPAPTATVLLPLAESSLAVAPTLASVSQTATRNDASVPVGPLFAVSFNQSAATALPASASAYLGSTFDEFQPAGNKQNKSLSLNDFLQLQEGQNVPKWTGNVPRTDAARNAANNRETSPGPVTTSSQEELIAAPGSLETTSDESAATIPAIEFSEIPNRSGRTGFFSNLSLAFSIPLIWGVMQVTVSRANTLWKSATRLARRLRGESKSHGTKQLKKTDQLVQTAGGSSGNVVKKVPRYDADRQRR